jgi:PII-like signaling protein
MQQAQAAEILRIHIAESDRYQGKPLYEAIVAKCRELKMAGATVFSGVEVTAKLRRCTGPTWFAATGRLSSLL